MRVSSGRERGPEAQTFRAQTEDLHRIRAYVRDEVTRAGVPDAVVGDLVLAVSEACANAALYSEGSEIRVQIDIAKGRVEVRVEDEGVFKARIPIPAIDGRGGRGIPLMIALMDEVSIREGNSDAPGTVVRLVKYAA